MSAGKRRCCGIARPALGVGAAMATAWREAVNQWGNCTAASSHATTLGQHLKGLGHWLQPDGLMLLDQRDHEQRHCSGSG